MVNPGVGTGSRVHVQLSTAAVRPLGSAPCPVHLGSAKAEERAGPHRLLESPATVSFAQDAHTGPLGVRAPLPVEQGARVVALACKDCQPPFPNTPPPLALCPILEHAPEERAGRGSGQSLSAVWEEGANGPWPF